MKYNNNQIALVLNRLQQWWSNDIIIEDLTKIIDKHLSIKDSRTEIIENYTNFKDLEYIKGVPLPEINRWLMYNEFDVEDIKSDKVLMDTLKSELLEFLSETILYGFEDILGI
jgi:intein-encoded DNA endonuclease-like protein